MLYNDKVTTDSQFEIPTNIEYQIVAFIRTLNQIIKKKLDKQSFRLMSLSFTQCLLNTKIWVDMQNMHHIFIYCFVIYYYSVTVSKSSFLGH